MFISKLSDAVNRYDQYGLMRVNAFQALYVAIALFLINFAYGPPYMQQIIVVFLFSFIAGARIASPRQRMYLVVVFTLVTALYSIALNLLREYNLASVLLVGLVLSLMFFFAKKIPLLGMLAITVNFAAVTVLKIQPGGNAFVYGYFMVLVIFYLLLVILLMHFFPRVYYFRVWLRSYLLSLHEINQRFRALANGDVIGAQKILIHFSAFNQFTIGLSNREFGYSARKINLIMLDIYSHLVTARMNLISTERSSVSQISAICAKLTTNLSVGKKIDAPFVNEYVNSRDVVIQDFVRIMRIWNKLCLKT